MISKTSKHILLAALVTEEDNLYDGYDRCYECRILRGNQHAKGCRIGIHEKLIAQARHEIEAWEVNP